MALRKISWMTEADHQLVTAAVADAEHHTSGEIVTIITDLSDHYEDIGIAWASGVAFVALATYATFPDVYMGLINRLTGGWGHEYTTNEYVALLLTAVALKWVGTWLILKWMPLRLFLTPKATKLARVRNHAISLFKVGTESKTVGRTGVLLYVSMLEHRAEIVADEAIASKVAPEVWGDAMVALLDHVKAGNPGQSPTVARDAITSTRMLLRARAAAAASTRPRASSARAAAALVLATAADSSAPRAAKNRRRLAATLCTSATADAASASAETSHHRPRERVVIALARAPASFNTSSCSACTLSSVGHVGFEKRVRKWRTMAALCLGSYVTATSSR
jgi:putative membrane protein